MTLRILLLLGLFSCNGAQPTEPPATERVQAKPPSPPVEEIAHMNTDWTDIQTIVRSISKHHTALIMRGEKASVTDGSKQYLHPMPLQPEDNRAYPVSAARAHYLMDTEVITESNDLTGEALVVDYELLWTEEKPTVQGVEVQSIDGKPLYTYALDGEYYKRVPAP